MTGLQLQEQTPSLITQRDVDAATVIFAIGCTLPSNATASGKADSWDDVPDDRGYGATRDAIKRHVERLVDDLQPADAIERTRRLRKRAGVTGFRFHDFRHDFASRLLRKTGNLKIVQKALNHADIKTTTRYAHVLDSEVGIAMEEVSRDRRNSAENSPNKSPRLDRKVG